MRGAIDAGDVAFAEAQPAANGVVAGIDDQRFGKISVRALPVAIADGLRIVVAVSSDHIIGGAHQSSLDSMPRPVQN